MPPHPKEKRLRDRAYLDSFADAHCMICGHLGAVAAHIRQGMQGGMGLTPDDNLTVPLCGECHGKQHAIGEVQFWHSRLSPKTVVELLKIYARQRYQTWKGRHR